MVSVRDVQRRPARKGRKLGCLLSLNRPHPDPHAVELSSGCGHTHRGPGERLRERPVGIGRDQEDRLEARPRRPQQREPVGLRGGVRLLVRPHAPRREGLRADGRDHADPSADLARRERVVLRHDVHRLGGVGLQHSFPTPRGKEGGGSGVAVFGRRRFRENEVDDIVEVPRGVARPLLR